MSLQVSHKPRTIYLRCMVDQSVLMYRLIAQTEYEWTVEAAAEGGRVRFTKMGYREVTEEMYWRERWATLERSKVIKGLYVENRIPFERLRVLAEMVGIDWEGEIERMRR